MSNPKRLAPTKETIKMLLLRSGNQCAFSDCNHVIFNDQDTLVAECCHIEAAMPGGERYNPTQTDEDRRSINNLLFLCHRHHVETDDVDIYTVEKLKDIKVKHEEQFRGATISVNDTNIEQVLIYLGELYSIVNESLTTVRQIDQKQDVILNLLKSKKDNEESFSEYFGIPSVYQFVGRRNEIDNLNSAFNKYNTFLIGGISGIGKTYFIAKFLSDVPSFHLLWIDCQVVDNQVLFFEYYAKFIKQTFKDNSVLEALSSTDNEQINRVIVFSLQKYNCCIVFDGLNSSKYDLYSLLKTLNKSLSNSKIIVITNYNWDTITFQNPIYRITLKGIDKNSFWELLRGYNVPNLNSEHSLKIHRSVDGHPYLLKLCVSILQYQPIDYFVDQLDSQKLEEISDYVKSKALETIDVEGLELLKKLSLFEIPFRYSIGEYILPKHFNKLFRNLKDRFLIETFQDYFFIIPEFIKKQILAENREWDISLYTQFVNYLKSSKSDIRIVEKNALIYFALNTNDIEMAKSEAHGFLLYLMGAGKFNFASKVSSDLLNDVRLQTWGFLYVIKGRIARFQKQYEVALENYNRSTALLSDIGEIEKIDYEKASMLVYLSQSLGDTSRKDALKIYQRLINSSNISIVIQCHSALARLLMDEGKYKEAVKKLETAKNKLDDTIEPNIKAQVWQLLGDAYSVDGNLSKAFYSYDISIDFYKIAVDKFGMNVIDGLYHLYASYGWTYSKGEDYNSATEMFNMCVGLCDNFDLGNNKEKALFDYGFHLILNGQFEDALRILVQHYKFVNEERIVNVCDMALVHAILCFAHWYSGAYVDAVQLLALYINSCYVREIHPTVVILEEDGLTEKFDVIALILKRIYILIIPTGKTYSDLKEWTDEACLERPELREFLNGFVAFKH